MFVIALTLLLTLLTATTFILFTRNRTKDNRAIELEQRVHERTKELQKYVDSLQRSKTERNFLLDGIAKRINASLATLKGLERIASTYENMPPELIKNIDVAADGLATILLQIEKEKKG